MLPLPVKKNKFGQRVADISTTTYYHQIIEEVLEAHTEAVRFDTGFCDDVVSEAEELVDVIATCITRLDILGYDESAREKLYQFVNEKNLKRGYFEE